MNATQKKNMIARAKRHLEQDLLIQGSFAKECDGGFKGCSVGCDALDILHPNEKDFDENTCHKIVADHDGVPEWLVHLRDAVFEGLETELAKNWHVNLAQSLPETEVWQPYYHKIMSAILREIALPNSGDLRQVVKNIISLHEIKEKNKEKWSAASSAAISAARSSARSAASSAAWSAAISAAISAASSAARSAAWSAAWSAASSAASSAAWSAAISSARSDASPDAWEKISEIVIREFSS